ncbi:hypothetical protein BST83_14850 [Polaribacter filamentus]|uniref:Glycosyltransferase 2-like domain-containing protein n=1 Tax=Polaribacter filamentus TaxID=53483 RepID=A0A2S7L0K0_9FLAO|nr:glycosyltransferase family 2 protein [Polaribacter filamentus]PQB08263.1 hypothetical protein BST83_14850 [Polaribacter filamentus]
MSLPKLSVIIVNYNGLPFLRDCFNSLKNHLVGISYEIIVVDNDSKDESCNFIKTNFPEVKQIESKINLGFGKANNLGVQNASSETILLLNNDTILLDNLLPAIDTLYSKPENGIVAINMVDATKKYICAVGRFPSPLRLIKISFLNDLRKEFKVGHFDKIVYEADWVSGSFMLMRTADYKAVNGFDSDYFMYVEDVDLCKKMKNLGKNCIFQSNLSYIHFVGFNQSREINLIKGYKLYSEKHFSYLNSILAKICLKINYVYKKNFKNIR